MKPIQKIKSTVRSVQRKIYDRINFSPVEKKDIVSKFHKLYYDSYIHHKTWYSTTFLGAHVRKCPFDLWNYQEMIYELKPDLIIETGTLLGGSAYYMATLMDLVGNGRIVTIDIDSKEVSMSREAKLPEKIRPAHPRITYIQGSSSDPKIIERVKNEFVKNAKTVTVILDSDHSQKHVLDELRAYHGFVTKGQYLIVEDSNVNGHPVFSDHGPGPMEAIHDFLKENNDFVIDLEKENHLVTFNPNGYLKKIR